MLASYIATVATVTIVTTSPATTTPCEAKCATAGHCCVGLTSACQKPSCAMGCAAKPVTANEAACNATCVAAAGKHPGSSGCTYTIPNTTTTFQMCGTCQAEPAPQWWPADIRPPDGQSPAWWPPGYSLPFCSSCDSIAGDPVGECKLGCMLAFRPTMKPIPPPKPMPPPPRPPPPACGVFDCKPGGDVNFSSVFSSHAVLQMQPAHASVYGFLGLNASKSSYAVVSVTVEDVKKGEGSGDAATLSSSYTVNATVDLFDGRNTWSALLRPAAAGGSYTITARCEAGCTGSAVLTDVTFGDVWYCSGQSNMALPVQYTYARNESYLAIQAGQLGDMRLTGLKGNMNADLPWTRIKDAASTSAAVGGGPAAAADATTSSLPLPLRAPPYGSTPLDKFSSTCFYFGRGLVEGGVNVPIGLVHTAWGGSTIEEWLTNKAISACHGAHIADDNEQLFDSAVKPYLGMSLKGWVWYQGENNAGKLHGNVGVKKEQPASGYACLMPKLVELWRREWSKSGGPNTNTTDPMAPFGIVSLSSHDSEGAKDMASFRWAQQGSYGTLPNKAMPKTFMAHAFDLQDPWSGNSGACDAQPLKEYDCHTPWYMGAGIHPRLKKPVGQRLALGALEVAYGKGKGVRGGVIRGCTLSSSSSSSSSSLTLSIETGGNRTLEVRQYNRSNPLLSATRVLVNATATAAAKWHPVHVSLGAAPNTIVVELGSIAASQVTAVRYAWGGDEPNGDDVSCCEGDGTKAPCVPAQCPLLAAEPLAPFGVLPVDPFVAEITKSGKCLCPEPQVCSA